MASKRGTPKPAPGTFGTRRGGDPGGLRRLPEAMHRLAAGDDEAMRRKRIPRAGLNDPRERVLIVGVNNKDSRRVYDGRVAALRSAIAAGDDEAVGRGLLEMSRLRLHRARNVVDFAALATSVLGLPLERAMALRETAAAGGSLEPLPDPLVSLFIRTESALAEHLGQAALSLTFTDGEPHLTFRVAASPVSRAVDALSAVGRQAAGLAHFLSKPSDGGRRPDENRPQPRHDDRPRPPRRPDEDA